MDLVNEGSQEIWFCEIISCQWIKYITYTNFKITSLLGQASIDQDGYKYEWVGASLKKQRNWEISWAILIN